MADTPSSFTVADPQSPEAAGSVLTEVRAWRSSARTDRHAYWLPLLVFGTLVCASAPMYVQSPPPLGVESFSSEVWVVPWLSGLGGNAPWGAVSGPVRGLYWLLAVAMAAAITAAWYAWHARVTGVATRVRGSLVAIALAVAVLVVVTTLSIPVLFYSWPLTIRGTSGLLVVAVGLAVLSRLERSWALAWVTIAYTGLACLGVFYDPANLVFRVYRLFGVADSAMPFDTAGTVNVLAPWLLLVLAGFVAFAADLRRR